MREPTAGERVQPAHLKATLFTNRICLVVPKPAVFSSFQEDRAVYRGCSGNPMIDATRQKLYDSKDATQFEPQLAELEVFAEAVPDRDNPSGGLRIVLEILHKGQGELTILNPIDLTQCLLFSSEGSPLETPRISPRWLGADFDEYWRSRTRSLKVEEVRRDGHSGDVRSEALKKDIKLESGSSYWIRFHLGYILTDGSPKELSAGSYRVTVTTSLALTGRESRGRLLKSDAIRVRLE